MPSAAALFTDLERKAYLEGSCHVLALALHRLTGWGLMALWGEEGGQEVLVHVFVEPEPGQALDVLGRRSVAEVAACFPGVARPWTEDATEEGVLAWANDEDRLHAVEPGMLEAAEPVARRLLEQP